MEFTKEIEELLKELIELGTEIEAVEYNNKFIGYEGFTASSLNSEKQKLRAKARKVVSKLIAHNIDPFDLDYSFIDENGIEWELEYAVQFI